MIFKIRLIARTQAFSSRQQEEVFAHINITKVTATSESSELINASVPAAVISRSNTFIYIWKIFKGIEIER